MITSAIARDVWLFLKNDSNHCNDKHTGKILLPEHLLDEWSEIIEQRYILCKQVGIDYKYIIVPDKECVYREYLPYEISEKRIVRQLQDRIDKIIYPIDLFIENKHKILYHQTDTHWNQLGVILFFNSIADQLHSKALEDFQVVQKKLIGDLGIKCNPKMEEDAFFVELGEKKTKIVYDNGIINRGHVIVTRNQNHDLPVGAIFGDSFIGAYINIISEYFSTLYFFHAQSFDISIIKNLDPKPDIVIQEQVERFLYQIEKRTFFEYLCDKFFTKNFSSLYKIRDFNFGNIFDNINNFNILLRYVEFIKNANSINQFYFLRYKFLIEYNIYAIWHRNFKQNYFGFHKKIQAFAFGIHYNTFYGKICNLKLFLQNIQDNNYLKIGIYGLQENNSFIFLNKNSCLYNKQYRSEELNYNNSDNQLTIDVSDFQFQNNSSYLFVIEVDNNICPGRSDEQLEVEEYFLRGYMRFTESRLFVALPEKSSLSWHVTFCK